jgi:adenylate cyclase, class 2
MQIEYEATFENVDKNEMRARLKKAGAKLVRPEFLNKRIVLDLPKGHEIPGAWIRILDNGEKITQTLKIIDKDSKIEDQMELEMEVGDFLGAVQLFEKIGCVKKSYQENKRELWIFEGVEITIDSWPFLESYVEIEGESEKTVRDVSEKLGFSWDKALFLGTARLYCRKYNITVDEFHNTAPKLTFEMKNPFKNFIK